MIKRKLGQTDLMLSPLVLGGNVFGWTADKKTSFDLLYAFTDNGFNCVDTASSYSRWVEGNMGEASETILGEWLKESGRREDVIIFTKAGSEMTDGKGLSAEQIIYQAEMSLKRLHTDYIDVYFCHKDDHLTPVEEILQALDQLIREGKIRYFGTSNLSVTHLRKFLNVALHKNLPQYAACQPRYNLCERGYENEMQNHVKKYKVGMVAYQALADGFLTGKYRSKEDLSISERGRNISKYLDEKMHLIERMDILAKEWNYPIPAIALAWLMKNETVTAPIASATSVAQLKDLMRVGEPEIMSLPLEHLADE
ncbi:MAG: aldo/keto reductase [Chitinophagaceae bacterium]|nr:aldo/keto reductase [Chitinophagaceae bacterium]